MQRLESLFKALGDPTRLRILSILLQQETCACQLQPALGLPQPFVSRHLGYLRTAGIVKDRRDGQRVWYSLNLEGAFGDALRHFLETVFPQFEIFQADTDRIKNFARLATIAATTAESTNRRALDVERS